jgi:Bacterial DNA-binding protein
LLNARQALVDVGSCAIGEAPWSPLAGEAVRVSGLGIFKVAARPARQGRNPQTGETIKIAASKVVRFHAGKAVKDALNPPTPKRAPRKKTAPPKSAVRNAVM